ncbi:hypothetical protein CFP65_3324 [Kitasatospora sp. MMS16-BH015]|uniref:hypothetical protein n=1 Tax=Kitasatospora sp. MMS16-BH015 TaxID=2018025 RepID=UPI000CA10329|nr:hypothetical protein [Kitasatospora sp. MMS16-BH015]AUG78124.1 hypothetical protein CFP65_3324 [Kitasatospora sp. MMS16-BH015]
MPITDEIKKTLSDPTPLYALAGAGDLAYEKLREVPGKVEALAMDRKAAQEKATARFQEAQTRLVEAQAKVTESVTTLPTDLKSLQEKAQTFALQQVGRAAELAVKAMEVYDELAVRGKAVVDGEKPAKAEQPAAVAEEAVEIEVVDVEIVEEAPAAEQPTPVKRAPRARKPVAEK